MACDLDICFLHLDGGVQPSDTRGAGELGFTNTVAWAFTLPSLQKMLQLC